MNESRKYLIFCARCGDQFNVRELPDVMRKTIDKPCRACRQYGVDAVETDRVAA